MAFVEGVTTDEWISIYLQFLNPDNGLAVFGAVKNAGSNSMQVRLCLQDVFLNPEALFTDNVIPGALWRFSSYEPKGQENPPYVKAEILIKSLVAGQFTDYILRSVER